jgi:2-(1,2-epoxy-1,2-dihydrophenyl)acetyl-CoA isomerase
MTFEHLLYDVQNGVCTITLNRPDVLNALNEKLNYELKDAFTQAGADPSVRVVVLTGAGRGFCSGADLKSEAAFKSGEGERSLADAVRNRYNPMILAIRNLPKPVIGRLHGVAAGAGCSLALACDLLVASEEAVLAEIFIGIGLVMDAGSTWFLPRLVGPMKAFEMATMGTKVAAKEALSLGLVNKVVPADQLDATVAQVAGYYAAAPTRTIGLIKQMLQKSYGFTLEEMLEWEALCQDAAGRTQDHREGVQAFLEKRKPNFTGK